MTQAKYFQKLKCDHSQHCKNGSGIIAGADITSIIKPILEGIDKFKNVLRYCSECKIWRLLEPDCLHKSIYKHTIEFVELGKAKRIIEEKVITVVE